METTQFHLAPSHFHLPETAGAGAGAGVGFVGGEVEAGASTDRRGVGSGGGGLAVGGGGVVCDDVGAEGFGLDTTLRIWASNWANSASRSSSSSAIAHGAE